MEFASKYAETSHEFKDICPVCNRESLLVREVIYVIPDIGKVLLVSRLCSVCGFKRNEQVPLTKRPRRRIYYRVSSVKGLYAKIVRSNLASIEIVELGSEISPGSQASFFITNVEGMLQKFIDILRTMKILNICKRGELSIEKAITEMLKGERSFTVIIDDPLGISMIKPKDHSAGKMLIEEVEGELTTL